jgi:hypothetical protein
MQSKNRRSGLGTSKNPFGCTGEVAEFLQSIEFTPEQERVMARAIALAIRMARERGRPIDPNEAMRRIAETWLAGHGPGRRPGVAN